MTLGKAGVCLVLRGKCCTFIPNNTTPDNIITKAFEELAALSNELAKNSEIDDPFIGQFDRWFGKLKSLMASLLTSLVTVAGILKIVRCLTILCIRGLTQN